ncbi:hypothetical protein [Mycobacterium sp. 1274761.0]|uniref:hypothetical protein n=1 Tax=Mycobacterium sp. 1274761.0 TaxID=1834077 RepID=UPI0007FF69EB|nr:hypothetical protein [Mycobacterium sp. 1274761.0]OBK78181.1 hypothetical protein A5651_02940 [Mycobacterium sp. 1274761.0]
MTFKRAAAASTLVAGVALAGLFGAGLGTASADSGHPCNAPGAPACQDQHRDDRGRNDDRGPAPVDWQHRGIDQARNDHQPFNWNGQQVTPMPAGNGAGWGFWFLGTWIPL